MDSEKEERDPFASIIEFCRPTASQEAKFPKCPLARESENFADSDPDSSPDPTPPEPTGIVMVSPPGSSGTVHENGEDAVVFHTPPEHHQPSSSEDQNLNELCPEELRPVDGADRTKKDRVFEEGLDDEPEGKRVRINGEDFGGETVPVGETEVVGVEGNEGVDETEVVVLDSSDSGDEMATVDLGEDSLDIANDGDVEVNSIDAARKVGELMKVGVLKVGAINGNHELGKKCKSMERNGVNRGEKSNEHSGLSGSLDSGKIEEEIVRFEDIVGNGCVETRQKSGDSGSEKVVKITEDANMPGDGYRDGGLETDGERIQENGMKTNGKRIKENGLKSNSKRIEEIDEFRYTGDADGRWNGRTGRAFDGSGRRRQLPFSLKGKEKDVRGEDVAEAVGTRSGLFEFLDVLKIIFGDTDGGCEDVDFLDTAKRRGLTFPKARWWSSEGDDD